MIQKWRGPAVVLYRHLAEPIHAVTNVGVVAVELVECYVDRLRPLLS